MAIDTPNLGVRPAADSEAPPWSSPPWAILWGLGLAYALGKGDAHWCYLLALFWVVHCAEERRRRRVWAELKAAAISAVAAQHSNESATWVNQLLRAVWSMYEPGIANYFKAYIQPVLSAYTPRSLGISELTIKRLCFGAISARAAPSAGEREQRLAPAHFSNVRMISKSIDVASHDPAQHRVKYVLQTDLRYASGDKGAFVLDISLGPKWVSKVFSLSVDAVVKELVLTGSLQVELEWVHAYPHLGTVTLAFVDPPSVDFHLHLGGSPDVMDLAPPLKQWLSGLVQDTLKAYIVGSNRYRIPLYEWYGEDPVSAAVSAALAAAHRAVPPEAAAHRPPPQMPPQMASQAAAAPAFANRAEGRGEAGRHDFGRRAGEYVEANLPLELRRQIRHLSRGELSLGDDPAPWAPQPPRGHVLRPPSSPRPAPPVSEELPPPLRPLQRPLAQRPTTHRPPNPAPATAGGRAAAAEAAAAALPPIQSSAEFFGSSPPGSPAQPARGAESQQGGSSQSLTSMLELDRSRHSPLASDSPRASSGGEVEGTLGGRAGQAKERRRVRATRAVELQSGAVGELVVKVHDVVNIVSEGTARLGSGRAPHVLVCASVGDGEEQRSQPASTSGGRESSGGGWVTQLRSQFRVSVHDNVTQRLRLRVMIKEDKKELYEAGSAEIGFAALGFGDSAQHTLALQPERAPTQLLRLQLTYLSYS